MTDNNILLEVNRTLELMGVKKKLTEASKKKVLMNKIGFRESIADYLDEVAGPFSVWLANKIIDWGIDRFNFNTREQVIENFNEKSIRNIKTLLNTNITSIMDFIRVGLNGDKTEVNNFTYSELINAASEWHRTLEVGESKIDFKETNDIVLDFRNNKGIGYYWVDLDTNYSEEECDRMGHCGRSNHGTTLYSLRSYRALNEEHTLNTSHVTAAIDIGYGEVTQMKGKKNTKPKEKYHKYIVEFLLAGAEKTGFDFNGFNLEYDTGDDFKLSDLNDKLFSKFFKSISESMFDELVKPWKTDLIKKLSELGFKNLPEPLDFTGVISVDVDDIQGSLFFSTNDIVDNFLMEFLTGTWHFQMGDSVNNLTEWYDILDDRTIEEINEYLKETALKNGEEYDHDLEIKEKIDKYDSTEKVENSVFWAAVDTLESGMYDEYYKIIKNHIERFGTIIRLDDEGLKIHVDLNKYNDTISKILEDGECDVDDLHCIYSWLIDYGTVETVNISSEYLDGGGYLLPDIDEEYFNEGVRDRLSWGD